MSGLPNGLTMCLNMLSLSFYFEDHSNILEFLSATTFSYPGMSAAETHICCSAAHCHMSKAISSHQLDQILPMLLTLICLMSLLSLKNLKSPSLAPKSSRALMCNTCSCLVYMLPVSDFSQTVPQPWRLA